MDTWIERSIYEGLRNRLPARRPGVFLGRRTGDLTRHVRAVGSDTVGDEIARRSVMFLFYAMAIYVIFMKTKRCVELSNIGTIWVVDQILNNTNLMYPEHVCSFNSSIEV